MSKELQALIVEQRVDEKSNGVTDADDFTKFVFTEIEKLGKMSLNQLMKEVDLIIEQYKGRENK